MPLFSYEAKDATGKIHTGQLEAESEHGAVKQLHGQGFFVSNIKRMHGVPSAPKTTAAAVSSGLWRQVLEPVFLPVGSKPLSIYFSTLGSMVSSGMNLYESMQTMAERGPSRILRRASAEMVEATLQGQPLSTVMPRHPAAFSSFVISMLQSGEKSGTLDTALKRLGDYFQNSYQLEMLARVETFYTKLLVVALILIPTLKTLILESTSAWIDEVIARSVPLALALIIVWYGWRLLMRLKPLRQGVDRLKLLIPWVGSMVRRGAVAKWNRAMAMLYGAGVPVHEALVQAGAASGNMALAASVAAHANLVQEGQPISAVMIASGDFPAQAINMMVTGERSGAVEESLEKVAEFFEAENQASAKQGVVLMALLAYLVVAGIIAYNIIGGWMDYGQQLGEFLKEEPP